MSAISTNWRQKAFGAVFILMGLAVLLGGDSLSTAWPLAVIAVGLPFLYLARRRRAAALAVPGAVVAGTGVLLFVQNLTGYWESWAYVWTLYPLMVGWGLRQIGEQTNNIERLELGRRLMRWGAIGFVSVALFFELLIFGGLNALAGDIAPLLLIAVGIWLLMERNGRADNEMRKSKRKFLGGLRPLRRGVQPKAADHVKAEAWGPEDVEEQIE